MITVRRLTQREQNIFAVCLILAFIYMGYNGLVRPFHEKIILLDQSIGAHQRKLSQNLRMICEAESLERKYDPYLKKFKQSKSNEQAMSSILAEIEEVAGGLNLRISNLKPNKVKKEEFYNRFSVSLSLESDFADVLHFLYILQNDPHLFRIEEVQFEKGSAMTTTTIRTQIVLEKISLP